MMRRLIVLFGVALVSLTANAREKSIRVFIALCDNGSQGIAPVPEKIGDGNKPADNLYWGCSDGFGPVFRRSAHWKSNEAVSRQDGDILEERTLSHPRSGAKLQVSAYRGTAIKDCLAAFEAALVSGQHDLVAFIGHNGLMDFTLELPTAPAENQTKVIVLCCKSREWFAPRLATLKATPVLLTEQFMYPGAFLLHDALESWLSGGKQADIRSAAAGAYSRNQKISRKAALGVFSTLP